jgi:hypothetical protein
MTINGELENKWKVFQSSIQALVLKKKEQSVIIAGLRAEIRTQNSPNNEAGVTPITQSSVKIIVLQKF